MSQEHFDHIYACGVSTHVGPSIKQSASEIEPISEVPKQTEKDESEALTEKEGPDLQAVSKKVLVESVNATDLGAIHEKLIKGSPNKNWYLNGKNAQNARNGSLSSSSTETCDSEGEAMDVDKESGEKANRAVDSIMTREQNNRSISPADSAEYTPMSPLPMDEETNEPGEKIGENLLKEIENDKEQSNLGADTESVGDSNENSEKSEKSDTCEKSSEKSKESQSQEPEVNGFTDHGYSKGSSEKISNEDYQNEETDIDEDQENSLNETDQNVTENSELNVTVDASEDGTQTDSVEPGSGKRLVSPLMIKRKGHLRGRGRRRGQGWTRVSPRKRSVDYTGYFDSTSKDAGVGLDDSLLDSSVDGQDSERRRPRRSRTPIRQNPDDYILGEKAFDDILQDSDVADKKPIISGDYNISRKFSPLSPEQKERYSEPMKQGWKREIVSRGIFTQKHPPMDVYYHPPPGTGPKLRSMVGISEWLTQYQETTTLKVDNFTFMRRPIGAEEGEVFRNASQHRGRSVSKAAAKKRGDTPGISPGISPDTPGRSKKGRPRKRKPEIVIERDTDDVNVSSLLASESPILTSRLMSSKVSTSATTSSVVTVVYTGSGTPTRTLTPARVLTPVRILTPVRNSTPMSGTPLPLHTEMETDKENSKINLDISGKEKSGEGTVKGGEKMEVMFPSSEAVIISPPKKKFKSTARKSTTQKCFRKPKQKQNEFEALCSLNCPGLEGISPLLRCNVCMCQFHPQCVNFHGHDVQRGFVCLRCIDLCRTVPEETGVVMEDGMMRVPDPTTFGSIVKSTASAVPIRMTEAANACSAALPNFKNLLSPTVASASSVSTFPTMVSASGIGHFGSLASPVTVRVPTPSVLKPLTTTQIKQEPIDPDDPETALKRAPQASSEALGNLKSMINTRIEQNAAAVLNPTLSSQLGFAKMQPADVRSLRGNHMPMFPNKHNMFPRPVAVSSPLYPIVPARGMQSHIDPLMGLPRNIPPVIQLPVTNSTSNNNILQTGSGLKLIPIGPPVKIQPGLSLPGMVIPQQQSLLKPNISVSNTFTSAANRPNVSLITSPPPSSSSVSSSPITESHPVSKSKTMQTIINTNAVCAPKNGQLLTLPPAVVKKITPNKPLQLKINNLQLNIPPSGFFMTSEGLKVFVPPNTFPTSDIDFCFSIGDDKTGDANSNSVNLDKSKSDQSNDTNSQNSEKRPLDSGKVTVETQTSEKPDIHKNPSYKRCCHIHKLYGGYDCMQNIFKLLNVRDLISVGAVCKTWRMISRHPLLWQDVSFKDVKVSSWQTAMEFLSSRKVKGINLLGLLHYDEPNRTWHQLVSALSDLKGLRRITFGIVPATVLHSVCERLTQLEGLTAESISDFNNETLWNRPTKLDIGKFACLTSLKELRLKGIGGLSAPSFSFSGGLPELAMLKNLQTLSIRSLRSLPETQFNFISQLTQIQYLAVGDCNTWTSETFFHLGKLTNLKHLRLDHGGEIPDVGLGDALLNLKQLEKLELYIYIIADSLGSYLKQLTQLKTLILWPDNCLLPAEVNTNTLKSISELTFLTRLEWALPSSCNTSIILDSSENSEQRTHDNGLQWIPFYPEKSEEESEENSDEKKKGKKQTEYIRLHELQEKVTKCLPKTRTKVFCVKPEDWPYM